MLSNQPNCLVRATIKFPKFVLAITLLIFHMVDVYLYTVGWDRPLVRANYVRGLRPGDYKRCAYQFFPCLLRHTQPAPAALKISIFPPWHTGEGSTKGGACHRYWLKLSKLWRPITTSICICRDDIAIVTFLAYSGKSFREISNPEIFP